MHPSGFVEITRSTSSTRRQALQSELQQQRMAEQQRLQNADVMGKQFVFGAQDSRENQQLNRKAGLVDNASADLRSAEAAYGSAQAGKYGAAQNMMGSLSGIAGVL